MEMILVVVCLAWSSALTISSILLFLGLRRNLQNLETVVILNGKIQTKGIDYSYTSEEVIRFLKPLEPTDNILQMTFGTSLTTFKASNDNFAIPKV